MDPYFQNFRIYPIQEDHSVISGECNQGILVVLRALDPQKEQELIPFLAKILQAVQLDLDKDAALIYLFQGQRLNLNHLRRTIKINKVICFGLSASDIGLNAITPEYVPFNINPCQYLFAEDLDIIYQERKKGGKQKAGKLWQSLKEMILEH